MKKKHTFTLTVETYENRKSSYHAVLFAFAKRDPDNCKFHLKFSPPVATRKPIAAGCHDPEKRQSSSKRNAGNGCVTESSPRCNGQIGSAMGGDCLFEEETYEINQP